MRRVRQTEFGRGAGNALQAAVASLFCMDLEFVPNFITLKEGYEKGLNEFALKNGKSFRKIALTDSKFTEPVKTGTLFILRGLSPRGDFGHVVLASVNEKGDIEFIHDPHPDSAFLRAPYSWAAFFDDDAV